MCVTSLLYGPRADLLPAFYGFSCKRFSVYIKVCKPMTIVYFECTFGLQTMKLLLKSTVKVVYKMHTPKSVGIVVDKYAMKTYFEKGFRKHLQFRELSLNCAYSFLLLLLFFFLLHEINTNKCFQWTRKP